MQSKNKRTNEEKKDKDTKRTLKDTIRQDRVVNRFVDILDAEIRFLEDRKAKGIAHDFEKMNKIWQMDIDTMNRIRKVIIDEFK